MGRRSQDMVIKSVSIPAHMLPIWNSLPNASAWVREQLLKKEFTSVEKTIIVQEEKHTAKVGIAEHLKICFPDREGARPCPICLRKFKADMYLWRNEWSKRKLIFEKARFDYEDAQTVKSWTWDDEILS